MFESLYTTCRKCGLGVFDFWNLTYGEIIEFLNDFQEQQKLNVKEQAAQTYQTALLTAVFMNRANNGKQPPTLREVFPNVFEDGEVAEPIDNTWIIQKEQMLDYAMQHNKKAKEVNKE